MLTLAELIHAATLEGQVKIRVWDHTQEDYTVDKWLTAFTHEDAPLYSRPVKYIYPLLHTLPTGDGYQAAVIIELEEE